MVPHLAGARAAVGPAGRMQLRLGSRIRRALPRRGPVWRAGGRAMTDDRDTRATDAVAAGVVSGGFMLAVLGAIIAAIVLHPALVITLGRRRRGP